MSGGKGAQEGIAKMLVQTTVRSFYPPMAAILIDQLIRKGAFRDDELASRVGMKAPDVAKTAQKLVEDQVISVHRRQELREGAPKAQTRTYYYLDYSHASDVIKWRMWKLQNTIDNRLRNELDTHGYVCPKCKKVFSTLDANMLLDPYRGGLFCDVCGTEVLDNENEDEVRGNKDRMRRLVEQTASIRELLKKMDDVVLPKFDVSHWLEVNGPAGTKATAESATPLTNGSVRIHLAGDDDEELMKAKREADAAEKRSQNQLPSWIAKSTVSDPTSLTHGPSSRLATPPAPEAPSSPLKPDLDPLPADPDSDDLESTEVDLSSYYASLAASATAELSENGSQFDSPVPPSPFVVVKEEVVSDDEGEIERIPVAVSAEFAATSSNGSGSRKRSRDEDGDTPDSEKRARVDELAVPPDEDDFDDEFDEFDEVEDGGDPNPLVQIGERMVPFLEVNNNEALQAAMTPDEYTAFWAVYQRLG